MNILPSRGCVYYEGSDSHSDGFYSVTGLSHGARSNAKYPILIHSVAFEDTDISSPVTTLSGRRVLYRFGKGVGNVRVPGEILLGPPETAGQSDGQNTLISFFQDNRISAREDPVSVTLPGGRGIKVYFNSLVIGDTNPENHSQPFQLVGYLADFKSK